MGRVDVEGLRVDAEPYRFVVEEALPGSGVGEARRIESEYKRALVLAVTDALLEAGQHPNIGGIARQAGVGRKFIYDHPDLKADIELKVALATKQQINHFVASARVASASLRAELANARAQNRNHSPVHGQFDHLGCASQVS